MGLERGGVYVQRGVDVDETPVLVHVDDLPTAERDTLRTPPIVALVPRETRGGVFVDAPDDPLDPDTDREPPKLVDDMTQDEKDARLGTRGASRDLPIDIERGP